jgi:hypothetical protein
MRRFVLGWKKLGLEQNLGTRIVTYADDLVILCRNLACFSYQMIPNSVRLIATVGRQDAFKPHRGSWWRIENRSERLRRLLEISKVLRLRARARRISPALL